MSEPVVIYNYNSVEEAVNELNGLLGKALSSMREFYLALYNVYNRFDVETFIEIVSHLEALGLVNESGHPTARLKTIMLYFDAMNSFPEERANIIEAIASSSDRPGSVSRNLQNTTPLVRYAIRERDEAALEVAIGALRDGVTGYERVMAEKGSVRLPVIAVKYGEESHGALEIAVSDGTTEKTTTTYVVHMTIPVCGDIAGLPEFNRLKRAIMAFVDAMTRAGAVYVDVSGG